MSISLREHREQAGLTQVELARRVGVTQPTISAIERSGLRVASTEVACLIARELKLSPEALGGLMLGLDETTAPDAP